MSRMTRPSAGLAALYALIAPDERGLTCTTKATLNFDGLSSEELNKRFFSLVSIPAFAEKTAALYFLEADGLHKQKITIIDNRSVQIRFEINISKQHRHPLNRHIIVYFPRSDVFSETFGGDAQEIKLFNNLENSDAFRVRCYLTLFKIILLPDVFLRILLSANEVDHIIERKNLLRQALLDSLVIPKEKMIFATQYSRFLNFWQTMTDDAVSALLHELSAYNLRLNKTDQHLKLDIELVKQAHYLFCRDAMLTDFHAKTSSLKLLMESTEPKILQIKRETEFLGSYELALAAYVILSNNCEILLESPGFTLSDSHWLKQQSDRVMENFPPRVVMSALDEEIKIEAEDIAGTAYYWMLKTKAEVNQLCNIKTILSIFNLIFLQCDEQAKTTLGQAKNLATHAVAVSSDVFSFMVSSAKSFASSRNRLSSSAPQLSLSLSSPLLRLKELQKSIEKMKTANEFLVIVCQLLSMRSDTEIFFCDLFFLAIIKQSLLEAIAVTLIEEIHDNNVPLTVRFHQPLRDDKLKIPLVLLKNRFTLFFENSNKSAEMAVHCEDTDEGWCRVEVATQNENICTNTPRDLSLQLCANHL